jgi:hypothetical protein
VKTQIAILESPVKALKESHIKVLQGDQDKPVVRARYSVAQRGNSGYGLPTPPGGIPNGWSLAAAQYEWTRFYDPELTRQIDVPPRYATDKSALQSYAWSTDWAVHGLGINYQDQFNDGPALTYIPQAEGGGPFPFNLFNAAYSGYSMGSNDQTYTIWRGQLRYDGLVGEDFPLAYWIARFRRGVPSLSGQFNFRYEFVAAGFITAKDATGYVCRECPFTTGPGAPPQEELLGSAVYDDYFLLGFGTTPTMGDTFL